MDNWDRAGSAIQQLWDDIRLHAPELSRGRAWVGVGMALGGATRRSSHPLDLPAFDQPGDEALTAERLVCTEEERVRLPPSPLTWGRSMKAMHPLRFLVVASAKPE